MQELREIDSPAVHTCAKPHVERWHIYEPVSMQWSWLVAYLCCGQVFAEPAPAVDEDDRIARAA
jgi:hypothetical protein